MASHFNKLLIPTSNVEPTVAGDEGFALSIYPKNSSEKPKRSEWLRKDLKMEVREQTSKKWAGVKDRVIQSLQNLFPLFYFIL